MGSPSKGVLLICTCMQKPSVHSHPESCVLLPALYMQKPSVHSHPESCVSFTSTVQAKHSLHFHAVFCVATSIVHAKPSIHSHPESFVSLPALYMQNPQFTLTQSLLCRYQHCTCKTLNSLSPRVFCVATSIVHAKPSIHSHPESFVSLPALYMQNPQFTLTQSLLCRYQHCTCKTLTSLSGSILCVVTSNTEEA